MESPPGPPVISTVVAEIYGPPDRQYMELIEASKTVMARMSEEPGMVDIDHSAQERHERIQFVLDKEKASLHGIDTDRVVRTLALALDGDHPATVHRDDERTPLSIRLRLPRALRSGKVIVAGVEALLGGLPASLEDPWPLEIIRGGEIDLEKVINALADGGYQREYTVEGSWPSSPPTRPQCPCRLSYGSRLARQTPHLCVPAPPACCNPESRTRRSPAPKWVPPPQSRSTRPLPR